MDYEDKLLGLLEAVKNLDIETVTGEVNSEIFDFYAGRFKMAAEDGCPENIENYLRKLQADTTVNEITRLAVLRESLKY